MANRHDVLRDAINPGVAVRAAVATCVTTVVTTARCPADHDRPGESAHAWSGLQFSRGITQQLAEPAIDFKYAAVGRGVDNADCDLIERGLEAGACVDFRKCAGGRGSRGGCDAVAGRILWVIR